MKKDLQMFNLEFNRECLDEAISLVVQDAIDHKKSLVITPNVDQIVLISSSIELLNIFRSAGYLFIDGMPLLWLSRLLPVKRACCRVTGSDLLPGILKLGSMKNLSIAIIGGMPDVTPIAIRKINTLYPGIHVRGYFSPSPGFESCDEENKKIIQAINLWRPDLILLALGAPKQELWASRHFDALDTGPILCFGAALDYLAGKQTRAPYALQIIGAEWLWRLAMEPGRLWRRYLLRDMKFIGIAWKEITSQYIKKYCSKKDI